MSCRIVEGEPHTLEGNKANLPSPIPVPQIDTLPSKETGIDRPCARAEQSQSGSEKRQQDVSPRIGRLRERDPYLVDGQDRPSDRRPQTGK